MIHNNINRYRIQLSLLIYLLLPICYLRIDILRFFAAQETQNNIAS